MKSPLLCALAVLGFSALANAQTNHDTYVLVGTLAGTGTAGFMNGPADAAMFNNPRSLAVDAGTNVYVNDSGNFVIRKITPSGTVSTLAGLPGVQGKVDGPSDLATFAGIVGLAAAPDGVLYVGDQFSIRRVDINGTVATIAGFGESAGYLDGHASHAQFGSGLHLALDVAGNLFISDTTNRRLRKLDTNGFVTTLAGSTIAAFRDGIGTNDTGLPEIRELTVASNGDVFFSDASTIRRFRPTDNSVLTICGIAYTPAAIDGVGDAARFVSVRGLVFHASSNLLALDFDPIRILRHVSLDTLRVTTLAGAGVGYQDGDGRVARFNRPRGLAIGPDGTLYLGDTLNHRIRTVLWSAPTDQPPQLTAGRYLGLKIDGILGRTYRIEYVTNLAQTNQWTTAGSATLTTNPVHWFDLDSLHSPQRYYRALLLE